MRADLKSIILGLLLALGASSSAFSQCTGNPAAGLLCGNSGATATLPGWKNLTSMLDRNFGAPSVQGTMLNRGASLWSATATPTLGLNGGTGGSLTLNGSSTGSAVIGVKAAAGSTIFNLPVGNGTSGFTLITDGAGNTSWASAGSGTVTSVGLSLPGIFNVTGSPVINTGTLTATLNTQTANVIWAGPNTGADAAPTFRALVGADLPNPGPSSLGGVESFAAVGSQWIRQISTVGVPTASQPAFTDISGTLAAAQCPNPSASTIGCVESLAAVTSKWINTISTSGVPSATQPNFSDIAGAATLSQLPSISNNSVLGNNSGGSAVPSAITATNVLDMLGTTQGTILYRNASAWVPLGVGTDGQVLTTHAAAANPTWTTVTGTGTVTSVATGTGLTGGPVTTTGTISFANIANHDILANISGGSAVPSANTMTAILDDTMGSTQGNILYRGASVWQVLAPGTNGQVLTQGASTPAWGSAGTVSNVTITASTGLGSSGTCNINTTGTCTLTNAGVLSVAGNTGAFTLAGGVSNSTNQVQLDGNYSGWALQNCTLAASVGSSILTVSLKDNAGNDPSSTSPCNINYRNVTAATGSTTLVAQTSALSITTNAIGASLGSASSNTPFRFWVVVFNNGGTNVLALINCTSASQIFAINESSLQSSTPMSASATSAGVYYTPNGTTVTSKAIRIIGYIEYGTGLTTAGTYASGPTVIQTMGPGVRSPGAVVQHVFATVSTNTTTSSNTYVASAVAQNFTKMSAVNPVWLAMGGTAVSNSGAASTKVRIYRGSAACTTAIGPIQWGTMNGTGFTIPINIVWIDIPAASGTTAAQYTTCFLSNASTSIDFPQSTVPASLVFEEIMG